MAKEKFYVVWEGNNPGIYDNWADCLLQVKGVEGAVYKSFKSRSAAEIAFEGSPDDYIQTKKKSEAGNSTNLFENLPKEVKENSLAVDAACSGNPGPMEYRGVYLPGGYQLFHFGPVKGTNNIGEFLAIVHALALIQKKNYSFSAIYSDSKIAIGWVKKKKCKTKLVRDKDTEQLFQMIERAENWLVNNTFTIDIIKWETKSWGEIPADFGRK